MEYKKFEPYSNGNKMGTLHTNWSFLKNRYLAGTLSFFITVTSLTGCSFLNKGKIVIEPNDNYIESNITETKENLEDQITRKQYFVNECLNNLQMSNENSYAQHIYTSLLEQYKEYANIEYNINPENINEYGEVISYSSIEQEQEKMLIVLNKIIKEIEEKTKWKYNKDFILINDDIADLTLEEELDLKYNFVNKSLSELKNLYETTGNTYAQNLHNKLLEKYKKYADIEYNINPENVSEYQEVLLYSSIEQEQEKMLIILNEIIKEIEETTNLKYDEYIIKNQHTK